MSTQVALPSEAEIATLMQQFYSKVERDEELGPIFAPVLQESPEHLDEMTDFWTTALRANNDNDAETKAVAHPPHPIAAQRYTRWLALFQATAADVLGPARGLKFLEQAERIAASLQTGLFKPSSPPQGRPPNRQSTPHRHSS